MSQARQSHRLMSSAAQLEEILFACLESADFDSALDQACGRHGDLEAALRRLAADMRQRGLVGLATGVSRVEIGRYRVLERFGEGGMGVIYRCLQPGTGREVALKVLRPELLHFEGSRARFRREIEAIARLDHPAIVPVFEAGDDSGVPFFTMAYVRGASLATVLHWLRNRDPAQLEARDLWAAVADAAGMPGAAISDDVARGSFVDAAVTIFRSLASALTHAHERGVLHRDIKPSNILLTCDGRAQLLDFGLAAVARVGEPLALGVAGAEALSGSHGQVGTPAYMAPELLGDEAPIPNPRFDVYGLGLVLYETLALAHPFLGAGPEDTRRRILHGSAPSLRRRNRRVRWELDVVCRKACARAPEDRYAQVIDFARDLERVAERRPIVARRPGPLRRAQRWMQRHPAPALAAGVLLAAALVATTVLLANERWARQAVELALYRSNIGVAAGHLMRSSGPEALLALDTCPEARRSFEWSHLRLVADATEAVLTRHAETMWQLDLSPDGALIASGGTRAARVVATADGALVRELPHAAEVRSVTFTDQGRILVTGSTDGLLRVFDLASGTLRHELRGARLWPVRIGEQLAAGNEHGEVVFWDPADGTERRRVKLHATPIEALAVSASEAHFASGAAGEVQLWRLPELELVHRFKTRHTTINDLDFAGNDTTIVAVSVEVAKGRTAIERFSTTGPTTPWPEDPTGTEIAFSRDGTRFAIGMAALHLGRNDGSGTRKVLGPSAPIVDLVFSPQGDKVFAACADGTLRRFSSIGAIGTFHVPLGRGSIRRLAQVDSQTIACGTSKGDVMLVDLAARRVVASAHVGGGRIEGLAPIGGRLVVTARDASTTSLSLPGLGDPIIGSAATGAIVTASASSRERLVVALEDGRVLESAGTTWRELGRLPDEALALAISSRGELVAVTTNGTLLMLDPAGARELARGPAAPLALGIVGRSALVSVRNQAVVSFDLDSGATVARWERLRRPVSGIRELAGGSRCVLIDWAGDVAIREPDQPSSLLRHDCSPAMLLALEVDEGSTWIASAGLDGTLYVMAARPIGPAITGGRHTRSRR